MKRRRRRDVQPAQRVEQELGMSSDQSCFCSVSSVKTRIYNKNNHDEQLELDPARATPTYHLLFLHLSHSVGLACVC